jgi:hypothetical protein
VRQHHFLRTAPTVTAKADIKGRWPLAARLAAEAARECLKLLK